MFRLSFSNSFNLFGDPCLILLGVYNRNIINWPICVSRLKFHHVAHSLLCRLAIRCTRVILVCPLLLLKFQTSVSDLIVLNLLWLSLIHLLSLAAICLLISPYSNVSRKSKKVINQKKYSSSPRFPGDMYVVLNFWTTVSWLYLLLKKVVQLR